MTICAILVYHNLILKQQRLQKNSSQQAEKRNEASRSQHKRDQQVLVMLLIQVFVYVISITPLMIMNLYNAITLSVPNKSADQINIEKFVFYIVEVIVYLFPVSSFIYTQWYRKYFVMNSNVYDTQHSLANGIILVALNQ
jgi:H+/gluconate symporter-like permease